MVSETTPDAVTLLISVVPSLNTALAILAHVFLFGLNAKDTTSDIDLPIFFKSVFLKTFIKLVATMHLRLYYFNIKIILK